MYVYVHSINAARNTHQWPEEKTEANDEANTTSAQLPNDKSHTFELAEAAFGHLRKWLPNDNLHRLHHSVLCNLRHARLCIENLTGLLHHGLAGAGLLHQRLTRILHHRVLLCGYFNRRVLRLAIKERLAHLSVINGIRLVHV